MSEEIEIQRDWMGDFDEKKLADNARIHEDHGMELRKRILFASLCLEYIANCVRALEVGRKPEQGLKDFGFNDNIEFLFKKGLIGATYQERFHAFRHIRNAFIHDIRVITTLDLEHHKPEPVPLMLELADRAFTLYPKEKEMTREDRLNYGLNIITGSVITECDRIVQEQFAKRGFSIPQDL